MSSELDRYKQKYSESDSEIVLSHKKSPRLIKKEEQAIDGEIHTRKLHEEYYDENERITHVDDYENVPKVYDEEVLMVNGVLFKHEVKERYYDSSKGAIFNKHGLNVTRLDCGHIMQTAETLGGTCVVCGKTQCDNCGIKVNNRVFCKTHVLEAQNYRQLY